METKQEEAPASHLIDKRLTGYDEETVGRSVGELCTRAFFISSYEFHGANRSCDYSSQFCFDPQFIMEVAQY
ncbi:hypothetical protein [Evansella tamaricis]|uniref:Uncharacterized protein n=1 Tax=Evansella tamaricis TaxID=2069301 RepID=A0ABS6JKF1_9BACI|nr:hypothetical protein [Evansella tamaricis]MBU9714166.1 hypothetical protein [Evansella tamaricis]